MTGAAPVPVTLIERMRRELTFESILTAYGLSEAVVVTMCTPDDDPETISKHVGMCDRGLRGQGGGRATTILLPPGEHGEIQLRGPNIMLGYLDDTEATAAAYTSDHWFHTGDGVILDARGYLAITDRLKDMYTSGGFNVYPAEVENAILGLDGVTECAVIGSPDERLGEVGLAFVISNRDSGLTEQQVIDHCRERLANFKVPRRVEFVDELPRSALGKVLKRELRDSLVTAGSGVAGGPLAAAISRPRQLVAWLRRAARRSGPCPDRHRHTSSPGRSSGRGGAGRSAVSSGCGRPSSRTGGRWRSRRR